MNRTKDYANFAGWFAGLGYIVMWPITAADLGGRPFGASIFCRDNSLGLMDLLCNADHPLRLPEPLHLLGFASALFVTVRLLVYSIRRARGPRKTIAVTSVPSVPAPPVVWRPRKPMAPVRPVTPRAEFGLRGLPRRH